MGAVIVKKEGRKEGRKEGSKEGRKEGKKGGREEIHMQKEIYAGAEAW